MHLPSIWSKLLQQLHAAQVVQVGKASRAAAGPGAAATMRVLAWPCGVHVCLQPKLTCAYLLHSDRHLEVSLLISPGPTAHTRALIGRNRYDSLTYSSGTSAVHKGHAPHKASSTCVEKAPYDKRCAQNGVFNVKGFFGWCTA